MMSSERRRNAIISGTGGAITGGTIGGILGSVGNDYDTINVLRDTKNYNKKKSKEFRALLSPEDQKSIARSKHRAYAKSPMAGVKLGLKNVKRGAKLRRGSLIGAGIGAASVGTLSTIDGATKPIHKSAFGIDHEVTKALTGRRGDKRNTKYALSAYAGQMAGGAAAIPFAGGKQKVRAAEKIAYDKGGHLVMDDLDQLMRGNDLDQNSIQRAKHIARSMFSGPEAKPLRVIRSGRRAGVLAGVGGYALYRKSDHSKKLRGVSKSERNPMSYSAFGVFHPEAQVAKALMPIGPAGAKPALTQAKNTVAQQKMAPQATAALAAAPGQKKMAPAAPLAKRMMECVECGKKANCDRSGCCAQCAKIEKAFGFAPIKALGMKASTKAISTGNKLTSRGNSAFGLRAGHLGAAQQSVRRGAGRALTTMGKNPGKTAAIAGGTVAAGAALNKPKKPKSYY